VHDNCGGRNLAASQPLVAPACVTVSELAAAIGAQSTLDPTVLNGVVTDSRALASGSVFFALVGERFDGHDFVDAAIQAGVGAVVVAAGRGVPGAHVPVLEVADTLTALGDLAAAWRRRFTMPVVAITGSNGKTTTKEIARSIFAAAFGAEQVLATAGNFNNLIGMPLTALHVSEAHRAAIFEMGMNEPGEIARMVEIAAPTIGLITCVAEAHLEGLGSIEGVAQAKGELFAGLPASAVAVVNDDDPHVAAQSQRFAGRVLRFGTKAEVTAEAIELDGLSRATFRLCWDAQSVPVELCLGGRHNVWNAVGAAACAIAAGIDLETIARGLAAVEPPPMRFQAERLACGVHLVNDAYNANPGSVAASLGVLADAYSGRNVVVLGDMGELGPRAAALHEDIGRKAAAAKPRLLAALGEFASDILRGARKAGMPEEALFEGASHEATARAVANVWCEGDAVLVKGSRGSAMERVAEELERLARLT
jgi:UDP-N-acetylmuramoyl-tripeptide--D-alanyl-D-alanine ligase